MNYSVLRAAIRNGSIIWDCPRGGAASHMRNVGAEHLPNKAVEFRRPQLSPPDFGPTERGSTRTIADKRKVIVAQGRPSRRKPKLSASGVSASANLLACLRAVKLTPALRTDRVGDDFARGWRHKLNAGRAFLVVFWGILIFGYFVS
jgi:hypothetical protein